MFADDHETGQQTREERPMAGQLWRVFQLVGCSDWEFQDELDRDWEVFEVPGSDEVLWLPRDTSSRLWDEWVDELAASYRSASSSGPMMYEVWQTICCVDDIYFIVDGGDSGSNVKVIGIDAYAEAIDAADGFIRGPRGTPVSIWSDENDPEPDDITWLADDDDDDDDEWYGSGTDDADRRALVAEARNGQQRLSNTAITHDATGVVLAGPGGSSPLPGPGDWHVVPVPSNRRDELRSTIAGQPVTVDDNGTLTDALLTQYIGQSAATRLADAFGHDTVWELSADEIRLILCDPHAVVAIASRDMT